MKKLRKSALIAPSLILMAGLAGCAQEGPLEQMGETMDQKIEQAQEEIGDATERQGPLERAGEKADEAIERAGEQASESLERAGDEIERATSG